MQLLDICKCKNLLARELSTIIRELNDPDTQSNAKNQYSRRYLLQNKDKLKLSNWLYRIENESKAKESNRQHYLQNKDKVSELNRKYRVANKEKLREAKDYHEELERHCLLENKAKKREYDRRYRRLNKDKLRESKRNYRLQSLENPETYTPRTMACKSWKTPASVREYFESISQQLHVAEHTDWYRISRVQIYGLGGVDRQLVRL
jgi:hypothetical protein